MDQHKAKAKELNLRCVFNNEDNKLMTAVRLVGIDTNKISDVIMLIGLCENLKNQYQIKLEEMLRIEK